MTDAVREAALAAMQEHGFDPNSEKLFEEPPAYPEARGVQDEEDDYEDEEADSEAEEEVDGTAEDEEDDDFTDDESEEVPTEYFGVDLSDLPPDKRASVTAALKERDAEIQRVQRTAAQRVEEDEDEGQWELPSDEELMQHLGYDPDDPLYEVKAETALPIAKQMLQMQAALGEILQEREVDRFEGYWTNTVDQLEADHNVEVDRDALLDYAIEHQIPDPVDAFSRYVLAGRKAVSSEAAKARQEAQRKVRERKKAASTSRPRGTNGDTKPKKPPVGLTPEEAARRAAKELGMDWGTALNITN